MGKRNIMSTEDTSRDGIISTLNKLSLESLELLAPLVGKLAEREGIGMEATKPQKAVPLAKGMELWKAKLRGERRSKRTIDMYAYLAKKFLDEHPEPTKADIRSYIDNRLSEGLSPAAVEMNAKP